MSHYTLAFVGFNAQQQESIAAVLYFATSALDDEWETVTSTVESDINFINLDAENGEQLLQEQQQLKKDYYLVLVAENFDERFAHYWTLEKKEQAPLSLRKLTELLNQIAICLAAINELPADEVDKIIHQFLRQPSDSQHSQVIKVETEVQEPSKVPTQPLVGLDLSVENVENVENKVELSSKPTVTSDFMNIESINLPTVEQEIEQQNTIESNSSEGNVFKLDVDFVAPIIDTDTLNITAKNEVTEFAHEVVESINDTVITTQQESLPDVSIVLPTRTLLSKNYFFGILQLALKDKACRIIRLAELPLLYISPDKNECYFAGTDNQIMQIIVADPKQLKVRVIKKFQLERSLTRLVNLHPHALDALLVRAVLEVSQGRLLKDHEADRKVELKVNLAEIKIEKIKEYTNIAKFMQQQTSDLFSVAESLQVPLAMIFDFYNICFLLGYIHILPEETQKKSLASHKKSKKNLGQFLKSFLKK